MNELALTGISLLLLVLAGLGSVGVLVSRRAAAPPEPEPQRAKHTRRRLTQPERESERGLILAGLNAGIGPLMIARLLSHSPSYNRRIVAEVWKIWKLNQHIQEPLKPQRKPILEAAV